MFEPGEQIVIIDRALVASVFLDDQPGAEAGIKRADTLVSDQDAEGWSAFYQQSCFDARQPPIRRFYAQRGLAYCSRALTWAAREAKPRFPIDLCEGMLRLELGERSLALAAFQRAAGDGDIHDGWKAEAMLAQIWADLGDQAAALTHAQLAFKGAPEGKRAALESLRRRLSNP
jgi:hypothetical protein